ncbi:MAG: LD-carboxypeptidase [bacterium]|nr:LD-carboxypeptidase [bacterium]
MGLSHLIVPPLLKENAKVYVVAPAGPSSFEALQKGMIRLKEFGFQVHLGEFVHPDSLCDESYLAASDEKRAKDLQEALADDSVDAIFITRGGYGTTRILHQIRWDNHWKPKWVIGFSDFTAFSLALLKYKNWCSISGPVIASTYTNDETETWKTFNEICQYHNLLTFQVQAINEQIEANGILIGGCLSLICTLIGTPFLPDFTNAFLILEDVGEPLYKIDRMLTQLYHCKIFDQINGLILGRWYNHENQFSKEYNDSIVKRCQQLTLHRKIPIIYDFPYGHFSNRVSIPIGSFVEYRKGVLKLYVQ